MYIIEDICQEILKDLNEYCIPHIKELQKHDDSINLNDECMHYIDNRAYEYSKDFEQTLEIYQDYGENYYPSININKSIDHADSHPKTFMSMAAHLILYEVCLKKL